MGINLKKVDFSTVIKMCRKKLPNEPITQALVKFEKSDSYRFFKGMRNRITHRLPFVTRGKLSPTVHPLLFPDNPESGDVIPQTENDRDVLKTCNDWVFEILEFIDQTSITAFKKIGRIRAVDKETGKDVDIEERFRKTN